MKPTKLDKQIKQTISEIYLLREFIKGPLKIKLRNRLFRLNNLAKSDQHLAYYYGNRVKKYALLRRCKLVE